MPKNIAGSITALFALTLLALFLLTATYPTAQTVNIPDNLADIARLFVHKYTLTYETGAPTIQVILVHFGNWLLSVASGLLFGLTFATFLLLCFRYWNIRAREGQHYLNVLRGAIMGAPLGLCVNCSFYISEGMVACGQRRELALAMLFSSPLLNIIVILMSFSLLPYPMGWFRLADTVIFLLMIPLLIKWANIAPAQAKIKPIKQSPLKIYLPALNANPSSSDKMALTRAMGRDYFWHFMALTRGMLPLILYAGLIASIITHLIAWENVIIPDTLPTLTITTVFAAIICVVMAALLPITMGLDVLLAYGLLQLNVMPALVNAVLFPFGSFSLIVFISLYRTFNLRLACLFLGLVSLIGVMNGGLYWLFF